MEQTPRSNDLSSALKKIATEYFGIKSTPLLLSDLPPLLGAEIPNYKIALEGKSLKKFIHETSAEFGYKLIQHPHQPAKIAIVPADSTYSFPVDAPPLTESSDLNIDSVVVSFLKKLARLSNEDLDKINIPVSILVKLFK